MAMVTSMRTIMANISSHNAAFRRFVRSLNAALIPLKVVLTYFAVVVTCYGPSLLAGNLSSLAVLLPFHLLLAMLLWSYFSVVFTDPGRVPPNWAPLVELQSIVNTNDEGISSTTADRLSNQIVSYCPQCNIPRPPRCGHCSICERCVLERNHHSTVAGNCIGAFNYKFFILLLLYAFLEAFLVAVALLCHLYVAEVDRTPHPSGQMFPFLSVICWSNVVFAGKVLFLLFMHLSDRNMGTRRNFEQVFGTSKKYWLIPWYSTEDLRKLLGLQIDVGLLLGGDV